MTTTAANLTLTPDTAHKAVWHGDLFKNSHGDWAKVPAHMAMLGYLANLEQDLMGKFSLLCYADGEERLEDRELVMGLITKLVYSKTKRESDAAADDLYQIGYKEGSLKGVHHLLTELRKGFMVWKLDNALSDFA